MWLFTLINYVFMVLSYALEQTIHLIDAPFKNA